MTILPDLSGCDQPAGRLVEIYSAAPGGAHSTLDGSLNVCTVHTTAVVAAIRDAGLVPFSRPITGPDARCGSGIDFTGTAARLLHSPEPIQHPRWCDRKRILCRENDVHASRPYPATVAGSTVSIRVWLELRHAPADAAAMVIVEVTGDDRPVCYPLPVDQARVLTHQLRWLVEQVRG